MGIALDLQSNFHSGYRSALCSLSRKGTCRNALQQGFGSSWESSVLQFIWLVACYGSLPLLVYFKARTDYLELFSTDLRRSSSLGYSILKGLTILEGLSLHQLCMLSCTTSKHRPKVRCASFSTKILIEVVPKLTALKAHQVPHL